MAKTRRTLTSGELRILNLIQEMYGPQNALDDVIFPDDRESVIFVKDIHGTIGMAANLTFLADLHEQESVPLDRIRSDWLTLPEPH